MSNVISFECASPAGNDVIVSVTDSHNKEIVRITDSYSGKELVIGGDLVYYNQQVSDYFSDEPVNQALYEEQSPRPEKEYCIINNNGIWAGPFDTYLEALAELESDHLDNAFNNAGRLIICQMFSSFDSYAADSDAITPYSDGDQHTYIEAMDYIKNLSVDIDDALDEIIGYNTVSSGVTLELSDSSILIDLTMNKNNIIEISLIVGDDVIPIEGDLFDEIVVPLRLKLNTISGN